MYDIVCDVIYDILCCPPLLTVVWQDTLCLVAPYPFRMEPLEDFDPLTDFDMTGGDDVWFARPQLFFSCTLCPTGQMENKSSHREVSLVFFSTFEPISLTPASCMQAMRRKRVQESRLRGAETLKRRREAGAVRPAE